MNLVLNMCKIRNEFSITQKAIGYFKSKSLIYNVKYYLKKALNLFLVLFFCAFKWLLSNRDSKESGLTKAILNMEIVIKVYSIM